MKNNLFVGQCFKAAPYGQVHYYKILCADNGQVPLVAYVSIYGGGIYAGKSAKISIGENAVAIAEAEFNSIFQKVTTQLLPIVEYYTSFHFRFIDDTTQYIDNIPFHPKGQCFIKRGEGCLQLSKLKNPFKYGNVTTESIYVISNPDCIGFYTFPSCRENLSEEHKEIDRMDFTQIKKYTKNVALPAFWNLKKELIK